MEYAYKKLMSENDLKITDLPEDARLAIKSIADIEKAIKLAEGKGKNVSEQTYKKLQMNDKFIVREILDILDSRDDDDDDDDQYEDDDDQNNDDDNSHDSNNPPIPADKLDNPKEGYVIEKELKALFDSGKIALTIEELKPVAPAAYKLLFDKYAEGEENGIQTTFYTILEKDDKLFHISKN